jgi:uncharacterized protein GlcG (DUF336 family)
MTSNTLNNTSARLRLADADTIIDASIALRHERKFQALTVVVLDAGGHVVAAKREDNSGILRYEIAFGKAWGALGMGRASRDLGQMAEQRPWFIGALSATSGGRLVPVAGGVLVVNAGGETIGAVGISGDTSDVDELCAITGIRAAGFASVPAEPAAIK